ncbi:hypothetical protein BV25DRAFT_1918738 [Artomyces pyxidatus]|uniref:Uncharacterized protein n=1 Tax=Artomyces pyxidatus TaxID=48021 RepID=A0ACB8SSU1_9AGAM|nr:hypothetical protein BV25DRAFT_1918738 [Artomyces pyxidatus]
MVLKTRAKNASTRPGLIVAPKKKRTSAEVNAEKADKEAERKAKEVDRVQRIATLAKVEAEIRDTQRDRETSMSETWRKSLRVKRQDTPRPDASFNREEADAAMAQWNASIEVASDNDEDLKSIAGAWDDSGNHADFEASPSPVPAAKKPKALTKKQKGLKLRDEVEAMSGTQTDKKHDFIQSSDSEDQGSPKKFKPTLPSGFTDKWRGRIAASGHRSVAAGLLKSVHQVKTPSTTVSRQLVPTKAALVNLASGTAKAVAQVHTFAGGLHPVKKEVEVVARLTPKMVLNLRSTEQMPVQVVHAGITEIPESPSDADIPAASGRRRFRNEDLPIPKELLKVWTASFLPHYYAFLGSLANPWALPPDNELVAFLQALWDKVFVNHPHTVEPSGSVMSITAQRGYEWRASIASAAIDAVDKFIKTEEDRFRQPSDVQEYVAFATGPGIPFVYERPDVLDSKRSKGAFRSGLVLSALRTHISATSTTTLKYGNPTGALALATVAVERGLKLHATGAKEEKPTAFTELKWGKAAAEYGKSTSKLSETVWDRIFQAVNILMEEDDDDFEVINIDDDEEPDTARALIYGSDDE